jgi:hypothetical protein
LPHRGEGAKHSGANGPPGLVTTCPFSKVVWWHRLSANNAGGGICLLARRCSWERQQGHCGTQADRCLPWQTMNAFRALG